MDWTAAIVHWLHLTAAVLWVGGTLATSLVVHPVLRSALGERERLAVYRGVGARFTVVQWTTWAVLLLTGSWKLWEVRTSPELFFGPFGKILAVKLSLVAAMAALSFLHSVVWGPILVDETVPAAERAALARRAAFWGRINGALMLAIVFCAVLLRFNPW